MSASALRPSGSSWRWRRLREFVLDRDGWRCRVPVDDAGKAAEVGPACDLPLTRYDAALGPRGSDATVDHVHERADAGVDDAVDDPANLRAACRRHNGQRAAARTNARRTVPTSRPW